MKKMRHFLDNPEKNDTGSRLYRRSFICGRNQYRICVRRFSTELRNRRGKTRKNSHVQMRESF